MTKMTAFLLLAIKYVLHFYFIFIVCVVCKVVPFLSNQRGKVLAELVEMEISTSATWAQDVSRASGSLAYNIPLSDSASADLCFCCHCQELRSQWMNRKESVGQSSSFITPSTLLPFSVPNCWLIMSSFRLFHPCQTLSPFFKSKFQLLTGKQNVFFFFFFFLFYF